MDFELSSLVGNSSDQFSIADSSDLCSFLSSVPSSLVGNSSDQFPVADYSDLCSFLSSVSDALIHILGCSNVYPDSSLYANLRIAQDCIFQASLHIKDLTDYDEE